VSIECPDDSSAVVATELHNTSPLIFDGHNDVLTQLMRNGGLDACSLFCEGSSFHVDLPKARGAGFAGGFFAIWVPSADMGIPIEELMSQSSYDVPLPAALEQTHALSVVMHEAAILLKLQSIGVLRICRSVADIRESMKEGVIAAVLHLEGAEAIDENFHALDVLHAAGLRSLGPVWSRPTIYGEGVPFRFPGNPDIGGGLTKAGKLLIKRCNEKRILIDLSHMNEAGFNDVAMLSEHPLVATHSNVHALCEQPRNLTDRQLAVIAESKGVVGLNFATAFLGQDGQMRPDISVDVMLRHLDHLVEHLGEDGVALGSDFDGAVVPDAIGDVAGLPQLRIAMVQHGYNAALMTKLCHENWLNVLERTWGE